MRITSLADGTHEVSFGDQGIQPYPNLNELTAFRGIMLAGSVSALLWGIGFALVWYLR